MRYHDTRKWIHVLFEVDDGGRPGLCVDYMIMLLIIANVIAVMLETVDPLYEAYGIQFLWFEAVSVTVFTIEYLW